MRSDAAPPQADQGSCAWLQIMSLLQEAEIT
jgi:hypothetical protein